jgi:hypothetical protein
MIDEPLMTSHFREVERSELLQIQTMHGEGLQPSSTRATVGALASRVLLRVNAALSYCWRELQESIVADLAIYAAAQHGIYYDFHKHLRSDSTAGRDANPDGARAHIHADVADA